MKRSAYRNAMNKTAAARYLEYWADYTAIKCLADAQYQQWQTLENESASRAARLTTCTLQTMRQDAWWKMTNSLADWRRVGRYSAGRSEESWLRLAKRLTQ
jgi:hypothetical protein